ncbi:pentatricopeptide repeat-containing protein At2g20710, mitochondrial-like isoform X3 [Herrania umbratica]|uniref:Pentatricopeptide repeat-containing protein At2g20710, mitochondrial-like isoform X3 n=1 Tax=Herrania umbratica TaxID=108875 RepID=A0A6J1A9M1_9ROSI|nr:pentatricopeptide repeat-containing protein At2g20710, mitochondrial-like isoform X3 [Herrania umbratica]
MKLGDWSRVFNNLKTHFDFKNVLGVFSYSTSTTTTTGRSKMAMMGGSMNGLFRKISPSGDLSVSIVPVLDQWVEEGNPVEKHLLQFCIKRLRFYKRYGHALEMSLWMTDKRYFRMSYRDVAFRLDLIAKVHGIEHAENYFNSVPKQVKGPTVYSALLNCYAREKSVEKAEALMQRMRDLGLDRSTFVFNVLLSLHYKTDNYEKLDILMHEMEEKGDAYIKVGHLDKAFAMLKKSEELTKGRGIVYNNLLTRYTTLGKKEEVLRIWELYKTYPKVYNKGYIAMICSLLKFDDIESAEKIFDEWESQTPRTLSYDICIPNLLLCAYSRRGLLEKFETFVNRILLKGGKPNAKTWYYFATALLWHNKMEKAVEAMKEAILIVGPCWKPRLKPSDDSVAACLKYLKGKGDMDEAKIFIKLLGDRDIISPEVLVKLLSYIKDGNADSKLDGLIMLDGGALHGSGEIHQFSEKDKDDIDCKPSRGSTFEVKLESF